MQLFTLLSLLVIGSASPALAEVTAAQPARLPDLAIEGSLNEIMVGGGTGMAARRVTWRHRQLTMYPEWAIGGTRKGECKIQIMYQITNMSDVPISRAFKVQLRNGDKTVAEDRIDPLGPRESRVVTTHGLFTQGHHWFSVVIDPDNTIEEIAESNNLEKFDYTLNGKCNARHKPNTHSSKS
jgi:hypothetical protein